MQATQFGALRSPIVDKDGMPTRDFLQWLIQQEQKTRQTLTQLGQFKDTAPIVGRTEGVGTTVANITSAGQLNSLLNVVADRNTDNIADATGSPLAGGKRGFVALDTNNRLANSFRGTAVNLSNTPASATTLSNDGASTAIPVAAATDNFAAGAISDNAGSVNPGVFGTFFVYHDDPTFAGGPVIYQFSASPVAQTSAEGRINDGKIITTGGAAKTGGGSNGGTTPGGGGGRGYNTL